MRMRVAKPARKKISLAINFAIRINGKDRARGHHAQDTSVFYKYFAVERGFKRRRKNFSVI